MESPHPSPGGMEQSGSRQAETLFDSFKHVAADTMRTAARTVRDNAQRASGSFQPVADYGRQLSDWLDRSASTVQDLRLDRVRSQAEGMIRRNPGRSLLVAAVAGLVVGAVIRRR